MSAGLGQTKKRRTLPPLELHWNRQTRPLSVREVKAFHRQDMSPDVDPPSWLASGPVGRPFDFCRHIQQLTADIVHRCPVLAHIDVSRLLFTVVQARNARTSGLQARVTPLRFRDGELTRRRRVTYQVQRFFVDGLEILYVVSFCLPRFLNVPFDEKLITLFHELYHLSPNFNGDLRRHAGRNSVHSHSRRRYDEHMAQLAREYLAGSPDPSLHAFLRLDFGQLNRRHGSVQGICIPRPRVVQLSASR